MPVTGFSARRALQGLKQINPIMIETWALPITWQSLLKVLVANDLAESQSPQTGLIKRVSTLTHTKE